MKPVVELSLEKQANIRIFAEQVKKLDREQAQEMLVLLYQQLMGKDAMYQHFLKEKWGIGSPVVPGGGNESFIP